MPYTQAGQREGAGAFSKHSRHVGCLFSLGATIDCFAPEVPHVPRWDITLTEGDLGDQGGLQQQAPQRLSLANTCHVPTP